MSYLLGIDVGTTRTAAAIGRVGANPGEIEMVNLGDRASSVPSVLFLGMGGSVLVGEVAERRAATDPDRVVREFKRRLGDPTPFVVGGRAWTPEELSARLVRWVVDRVAEREGGPAARVAVTHPASWGEHKKKLLAGGLAGQGLSVTFLAEPQAAALHYAGAERVEPGSAIAVYDLGGGTFDAAVVRKADPGAATPGAAGFGLLGRPEGIERLGGVDFDEVVFEHVREGLPGAFEGLDDSDPAVLSAVLRVRRECTEAKEALSSDTEASIPVLLPASRGSVRLHRSEFEGLIRPQVEQTVAALRRAVSSAGLAPEDLSAVLLVGGSSRIPLVSQLVSEQLGRPVAVDADPKNAIAKGAALALVSRGVSGTGPNAARVPPAPVPARRKGPSPGRPPIGAGAVAGGAVAGGLPSPVGAGSDKAPTVARADGHPAASRPAQPAAAPVGPPQRRDRVHQDQPVATPGNDSPEELPGSSWNPAVLVGAGGLAAVAAVLTVVFLLSGGQDETGAGQPQTVAPASSSTPAAPPPTEEPPVPAAPIPAAPTPSRAAPRTTPPPVSTTPPPTSTAPTTTPTPTTPPTSTPSTPTEPPESGEPPP